MGLVVVFELFQDEPVEVDRVVEVVPGAADVVRVVVPRLMPAVW